MDSAAKPANSPRCFRRIIAFFVLLLVGAAAVFAFRHAGRWLICVDSPGHADAIVVLSGSLPYRAEAASDIFLAGDAPVIWISRPQNPSPVLNEIGITYVGEEGYNREVLIRKGVPESVVTIFPRTIVDTEEEVEEISQLMRQEGKGSVIIVTSPQHTRRVRALWDCLAGKDQRLIVRPATEDPFDADHWWRNTRDALSVLREYLGLFNVWLGLPVRPYSR